VEKAHLMPALTVFGPSLLLLL